MAEKLVLWQTPFSQVLFPSVLPVPHADQLALRVEAQGHTWRIEWPHYASIKVTDESVFPLGHFNSLPRDRVASAYRWFNSAWLREFAENRTLVEEAFGDVEPGHYVVLGGDHVVEVISCGEPRIVEVEEGT